MYFDNNLHKVDYFRASITDDVNPNVVRSVDKLLNPKKGHNRNGG